MIAGDPNNIPASPPDIVISTTCAVQGGPGGANNATHYFYGNINIVNGGTLTFNDAQIDFWAKSIIVENGGSLLMGNETPIGTAGKGPLNTTRAVVTINLWGPESSSRTDGAGVPCIQKHCGIPDNAWNNGTDNTDTQTNGVKDFFYAYDTLPDDGADPDAYFGYKVIGLGFGGTLQMFGIKGMTAESGAVPEDHLFSGTSWLRLSRNAAVNDAVIYVQGDVSQTWEKGDQIVLTTTDYVPGHTEQLIVASTTFLSATSETQINLDTTNGTAVQYPHNGTAVNLTNFTPSNGGTAVNVKAKLGLNINTVQTQAAVGLLSRSIVIQSGGNTITLNQPDSLGINQPFPVGAGYFGGHTIFRQGFQTAELQGVEFHQLGQGGKIGHYPVHFHMARQVPSARTFVKDCSINESMTRWIVLHATQGVTLARNVGYLSIGHGFYLEDATEANNNLFSNLGVFARAAIINPQNPRQVPGILARPGDPGAEVFPYHSDYDHPSIFWITNTWNAFEGNMAVGAGTCGSCYWMPPAAISGGSRDMKWRGYAAEQAAPGGFGDIGRAGITPISDFYANSCSAAMSSLVTVGDTSPCLGVGAPGDEIQPVTAGVLAPPLPPVPPPPTPAPTPDPAYKAYYPNIANGGYRVGTVCPDQSKDCGSQAVAPKCTAYGPDLAACTVNIIDDFTTSFNWSQINFSSVWLRQNWYLFINSAITDVQEGGLTFVTGGDYTRSSAAQGFWALAKKSVFIGATQPNNPFASEIGPFVPGGLTCDTISGNHCGSNAQGISFPLDNYGNNQRFENIYDGPSYEDANGYLDINTTTLTGCPGNADTCFNKYMYARPLGLLKDNSQPAGSQCFVANAAIAWKQPNGFFYPPAFHSSNLYFNNVDIRHFVVEPDFQAGTYITDPVAQANNYCSAVSTAFNNFSDVDRQTELSDDDGSLTGLVDTVSVNQDEFFNAPLDTPECASNLGVGTTPAPTPSLDEVADASTPTATPTPTPVPTNSPGATARTSPYEYVTTAVYPKCAADANGNRGACGSIVGGPFDGRGGTWSKDCTSNFCYGVPLYRLYQTGPETVAQDPAHFLRLSGVNGYQRSGMTVNNGLFYLDTTKTLNDQNTEPFTPVTGTRSVNVFQAGQTYYVYFLFATNETTQTYKIYVGPGYAATPTNNEVFPVRVNIDSLDFKFAQGTQSDWNASGWSKSYDKATGILTVTVNMANFKDLNPLDNGTNTPGGKDAGLCKPTSFCNWASATSTTCGCNANTTVYPILNVDSTLPAECATECGAWAVKDLDCPPGGCYGFGFTLPAGFDINKTPLDPDPEQPTPACFPQTAAWTGPFDPAGSTVAGSCTYGGPPSGQFCAAGSN